MSKINRIGPASRTSSLTVRGTTAPAWSGGSKVGEDFPSAVIHPTDFGLLGGEVVNQAADTFTMAADTRCAFGQQATLDIPYGDSILVEIWGSIQGVFWTGDAICAVAGIQQALASAAMEIEQLRHARLMSIQEPITAGGTTGVLRTYSFHETVVVKAASMPVIFGFGIGIIHPGAEAAGVQVSDIRLGYRTLADQFYSQYYDPAR